ncbi:TIGR03747 family integrating conjugative element membrane protein [Pseudomonas protegens]|uniref:TIGR03747 family integrating conjugative element membrane protein n=1 Tax=Pseudomonas protegens TaxID=380021 RepID=UPI0021C5ECCA|nr:TIGR03747 family integrating conjugative element membrane protein [Pseudomonas protegens]MCU1765525.1 TIGR03747 family integrating conjugative element membrane protein [Pseudomonas protegens]
MAEIAEKAKQQQEGPKTLLGIMFSLPFAFIGVMFGGLFGAILVEWICMYFFWSEAGWQHAQHMFEYEISWLSQDLLHSVIVQEPGRTATWLTRLVYDWVMVKSGLQDNLNALTEYARLPRRHSELDLRYEIGWMLIKFQDYGLAALYTALTFCVRIVILILTIPLFTLAAFTGLVDGLVRRDLRKFGYGRESSYLYHKARGSILPLVIVPWTIYLAIPVSINPLFVLLPCAALLALSVSITISSFKKYI